MRDNRPAQAVNTQFAHRDAGRLVALTTRKQDARITGMDLSNQVRNAIKSCGMTRYAIAKATGVSEGGLSRFMAGTGGMTVETLDKLAEYLGLEIVVKGIVKGRKR